MAIILKNTPIGRRAFLISEDDLALEVRHGRAKKCEGYDIFEEITEQEVAQGYMTRNMEALPIGGRKQKPKPKRSKMADEENLNQEVDEAAEETEATEATEASEGEAEATEASEGEAQE